MNMDLGVQGLEAVKLAMGPPQHETTTKQHQKFNSLPFEERVKFSTHERTRVNDVFRPVKITAWFVLKAVLIKRLLVDNFVSNSKVAWVLVSLYFLNSWKAERFPTDRLVSEVIPVQPFFGVLLGIAQHRNNLHGFVLDLLRHVKFQTIMLPAPLTTSVVVMDARDREYVLKTNAQNYLKNFPDDSTSFEMVFAELLGRGIFATDQSEWLESRKTASHMFTGHALAEQMERVFNLHADHVVELLSKKTNGTVIDMQEVFQCAVFDAFCEIAFDHHANSVLSAVEGQKPGFLVSFDFCQGVAAERTATHPLAWMFSRLLGQGKEAEFKTHAQAIDDYIYPLIRSRLAESDVSQRKDLLSLYIQNGRAHNQELSEVELRDVIVNFMIAGRDTTSCLLTYSVKYLNENVDARQRLMDECLTGLFAPVVTFESTKHVPFADAVVNEVLRLAPPVANDFRMCIERDVLPSGQVVLPRSRMLLANQAIGRDPFLWANPESFVPERWMRYDDDSSSGKRTALPVKRVDEYVHPVFFAGRRLCLGRDMARYEAITFMTKLFTQLEITPLPNQSNATATGPVIFLKHGLKCTVELK
ncbi:hypothetical protein BASA81_003407 [Batrachochytrium salamandrivorans]|nr:hypothetical protein BASA81_003407 [Batrachochytrium salamandrivorans]